MPGVRQAASVSRAAARFLDGEGRKSAQEAAGARVEGGDPGGFETLLAGREAEAKVYSPNETFLVNDVVRHPSFGVGVATATPGPQKVELTFRDGSKKVLLHDRGGTQASRLGPAPRRDDAAPNVGTSDSPRGQK